MKCKNCKHYRYGSCDSEKFVDESTGADAPEDGIGVSDVEGYGAGFNVGKNFGCIHFKKK